MKPEDIYSLTSNFNQPLIFKNVIKWKLLTWDLQDWDKIFKDELLVFRKIPFINTKVPLWENQCETVELTMADFIKYQNSSNIQTGTNKYSLYFDYKYMKDYFHKFPEILQEVRWSDIGYHNITGNESTIWIGNKGAHTLCHQDCYGYNLIAEIYGRKEWILFPPETKMHPTRVPFEESTVFSKLNLFNPNIKSFENISGARRVILEPGDVLFLPHGWWHYVENLDTAISINTWIPVEIDHRKRIEEGLISIFIQGIIKNLDLIDIKKMLNPNSQFLFEESTENLFICLQKVLSEYEKIKYKKNCSEMEEVNCKEMIENNENVEIIEEISHGDFVELLKEKLKRYDFVNFPCKYNYTEKYYMLENIVNAFCSPENISRVADTFIENNINK